MSIQEAELSIQILGHTLLAAVALGVFIYSYFIN